MRNFKSLWLLIAVCLLLLFLYKAVEHFQSLLQPVSSDPRHQIVQIKKGMSLSDVTDMLEEKGLIKSRLAFIALAFVKSQAEKIKAGEYQFSPSQSSLEILGNIVQGKVLQYLVIIPEGYNKYEIATLLEDINLVEGNAFLEAVDNHQLMDSMGIQADSAEGYLFPDSYYFTRDVSPEKIIKVMAGHLLQIWDKEEFGKMAEKEDISMHDVLTLASIVEKEAMLEGERPVIAGVFWNRLKKGMPLQADPTVIYGKMEGTGGMKGILKASDLREDSPYNTYTNKGIPKGPICNPGKESIRAVLEPTKTDFLYFVSRGNGSHYFSKTLREHINAINKYLKAAQEKTSANAKGNL